ncbi:MAG: type II toxin-antitoxin system RelE/ParE family toxin, partial [Sphingobium sp.]
PTPSHHGIRECLLSRGLGDVYKRQDPGGAFLRELVIDFGASGYVLLFEIENSQTVTVLAVRHQREDDYY